MSGSSRSTASETEGNVSSASENRYNMRARPSSTESRNRTTGRKQTLVNYKEQGFQESSCDSDYEVTPKVPQPLDNKSYPLELLHNA